MQNENDVAAQIVGFFQQFLDIFKELQGKNLYLTGESYAGMYVPCKYLALKCHSWIDTHEIFVDLANYIYEHPDELALDLQGIFITDREP